MQKFSEEEILQRFDDAIALTTQIRKLLENASAVDTIAMLYDKRAPLLEQLSDWRRSSPMSDEEFCARWDERALVLMDSDKDIIAALDTLKHTYQEKLRENTQRKYLLIYSKG